MEISNRFIPLEIIYIIIIKIDNPLSFKNISRVNLLCNTICRGAKIQNIMKNKLKILTDDGFLYKEYFVLPNKDKHGEYKEWFDYIDHIGQLKILCYYIDNKLNGVYKEWHDDLNYDNQLKILCNYINGNLDGKYTEWNENGTLKIVCHYSDNKLDGEYIYYFNGTIFESIYYVNGARQYGYMKFFDDIWI